MFVNQLVTLVVQCWIDFNLEPNIWLTRNWVDVKLVIGKSSFLSCQRGEIRHLQVLMLQTQYWGYRDCLMLSSGWSRGGLNNGMLKGKWAVGEQALFSNLLLTIIYTNTKSNILYDRWQKNVVGKSQFPGILIEAQARNNILELVVREYAIQ